MEPQIRKKLEITLETSKQWHELTRVLEAQLLALREIYDEYGEKLDYDILSFCHSILILTNSKAVTKDISVVLDRNISISQILK